MVSHFKHRRVNSLNSMPQINIKMLMEWLTKIRLKIISKTISILLESQANNRYDRECSGKFVSFVQNLCFNLMILV